MVSLTNIVKDGFKIRLGKKRMLLSASGLGLFALSALSCNGDAVPTSTYSPENTEPVATATQTIKPSSTAGPTLIPTLEATEEPEPTDEPDPTKEPDPTEIYKPPTPTLPILTATAPPTPTPPTPTPPTPTPPILTATAPPTPTPPPKPTDAPIQNPVEVYANDLGFPIQVVDSFKTYLGGDNQLSGNDRAYIDKTKAQNPQLWLPMSNSVLIKDGNVSIDDLAKTDLVITYDPLLAAAVITMPDEFDMIKDGLDPLERKVLGISDTRLFSNPNFKASKFSPDNWTFQNASVQAIPLMMQKIDISRDADNVPVVNYDEDNLDIILDGLGVYPGMCVYCFGKGSNGEYATSDARAKNYYPLVNSEGNIHREMLKNFMYLVLADGEGILLRSFMENNADDFELLYRRNNGVKNSLTFTSLGFQNTTFMTPMRLPDGSRETFMTTIYKIIGDTTSPREAAEKLFDYERKNWEHFTGGSDDFAALYGHHFPENPHIPPPGYVTLVNKGGSPLAISFDTAAFRLLGIKADHFHSPRENYRTGSVVIDEVKFYYNGNDFFNSNLKNVRICAFFRTLLQVENYTYNTNCN
jgi:hypothetical protein